MSTVPVFLSFVTTLTALGLVGAAVLKIFQMAANVEEMKGILKDIRLAPNGMAAASAAPDAYVGNRYAPLQYPAQPYTPQSYPSSAGVSALAAALPQTESPAPTVPAAPSPTPVAAPQEPLHAGPGLNFSRPPTAEELVRAIHAQDFRGDDFPL